MFTSVLVVRLRIRTKIRAPPAQRNADPRAGAISSNGTPPALEKGNCTGNGGSRAGCVFRRSAGTSSLRVTGHGSPFK
ncbi:unnamed protein product [Staurois parvus]|uniref:Uncharacterized protein n=1 Tax=Staurois parvus TaxID=386267 RepID=A0ABN9CA93_9NEOB|nr:unnamed protein product [Staurois parvus]